MILLGVCLGAVLLLVRHVVKMWLEARMLQKDIGKLEPGSVWLQRPRSFRNDPFAEDAPPPVTVQETRVNSDGWMWVKYKHKSGFVETDPADVFVRLYLYVEDQDQAIKGDEVQRMARGMVRIAKQGKNGNKNI